MPRKSRKRLIGKPEDIEQSARYKELAQLEQQLHEEHRNQIEANKAQPPTNRREQHE